MTRPSRFTAADLARAVRVADAMGKVALVLPHGIALVDPARVPLASQDDEAAEVAECDKAFGVSR